MESEKARIRSKGEELGGFLQINASALIYIFFVRSFTQLEPHEFDANPDRQDIAISIATNDRAAAKTKIADVLRSIALQRAELEVSKHYVRCRLFHSI